MPIAELKHSRNIGATRVSKSSWFTIPMSELIQILPRASKESDEAPLKSSRSIRLMRLSATMRNLICVIGLTESAFNRWILFPARSSRSRFSIVKALSWRFSIWFWNRFKVRTGIWSLPGLITKSTSLIWFRATLSVRKSRMFRNQSPLTEVSWLLLRLKKSKLGKSGKMGRLRSWLPSNPSSLSVVKLLSVVACISAIWFHDRNNLRRLTSGANTLWGKVWIRFWLKSRVSSFSSPANASELITLIEFIHIQIDVNPEQLWKKSSGIVVSWLFPIKIEVSSEHWLMAVWNVVMLAFRICTVRRLVNLSTIKLGKTRTLVPPELISDVTSVSWRPGRWTPPTFIISSSVWMFWSIRLHLYSVPCSWNVQLTVWLLAKSPNKATATRRTIPPFISRILLPRNWFVTDKGIEKLGEFIQKRTFSLSMMIWW